MGPGVYVVKNNDDDDRDGVIDYFDGYNKDEIPGNDDDTNVDEEDLVKVHFGFEGFPVGLDVGKVTIKRANVQIKLWKNSTKGEGAEIEFDGAGGNEKVYDLSVLEQRNAFESDIRNQTRWIEGYAASGSRGQAWLTASYSVNSQGVCLDTVDFTVIDCRLVVYK